MEQCSLETPDDILLPDISNLDLNLPEESVITDTIVLNDADLSIGKVETFWIPSQKCQESLNQAKLNDKRLFYTMPGLSSIEFPALDVLQNLLRKHSPDSLNELIPSPKSLVEFCGDNLSHLHRLLEKEKYKEALHATSCWLSKHGQGVGCAYQKHSANTPASFEVWRIRFQSMISLGLLSEAAHELEPFGEFEAPDLYFEYYSDLYSNEKGSMIPFQLRIIYCDLPRMMDKPHESITRVVKMIDGIEQILNLGRSAFLNDPKHKEFLACWTFRLIYCKQSLANCFFALKDYRLSLEICQSIINLCDKQQNETKLNLSHCILYSTMGRLCLQLGDCKGAQSFFDLCHKVTISSTADSDGRKCQVLEYLNRGFLNVFCSNYADALVNFTTVLGIEPDNVQAISNASVCQLYLGRLIEAIEMLESLIQLKPNCLGLDSGIFTNLCTLYELLSGPKCAEKKVHLLRKIAEANCKTLNVNRLKLSV